MTPTATLATSAPAERIQPMPEPRIGATCTVPLATLKRALTRAKGATSRYHTSPFGGVRVYCGADGGAYVEATDGETAVCLSLAVVDVSDAFDTLVSVRDLSRALKSAPKGAAVKFTVQDGARVSLYDSAGTYSLSELRRADFPHLALAPLPVPVAESSGADLVAAVARAGKFASKDQTRPVLTGVFITSENGGRLVATDSYRLDVAPLAGIAQGTALNVPAAGLAHAIKGAEKRNAAPVVRITTTDGAPFVVIERPGELWRLRVINGQYPNYQQLLPEESAARTVIHIGAGGMGLAASGAATVIERNAPLRLTFKKDSDVCALDGNTPDGTGYHAEVSTDGLSRWQYEDETLQIGVNPQFFADALSVQHGSSVPLAIIGPLKPMCLRDLAGGVTLLMPIRLN